MNEATRLANLVLEKRGYLVAAYSSSAQFPEPGDILPYCRGGRDLDSVEGPMIVAHETTKQDFDDQLRLVGRNPDPSVDGRRYFRLVAE